MDGALRLRLDAPTGPEGCPVLVAGSRVDVEVTCTSLESPESLQFRLAWRTEGKGDTDAGVGTEGRVTGSGGRFRFSLEVPAGPWSYAGRLVKIRWELEVWPDVRGLGEASTDVTVLPRDRVERSGAAP